MNTLPSLACLSAQKEQNIFIKKIVALRDSGCVQYLSSEASWFGGAPNSAPTITSQRTGSSLRTSDLAKATSLSSLELATVPYYVGMAPFANRPQRAVSADGKRVVARCATKLCVLDVEQKKILWTVSNSLPSSAIAGNLSADGLTVSYYVRSTSYDSYSVLVAVAAHRRTRLRHHGRAVP